MRQTLFLLASHFPPSLYLSLPPSPLPLLSLSPSLPLPPFLPSLPPSLLPSGEHVRIELIQLNDDHTGGRILARYESPTRSFLFPSNRSPAANTVVEVTMNRSRKYKVREKEINDALHWNCEQ